MASAVPTLKQMVLQILQGKQNEALKPSEIATIITQQFPDYCAEKTQNTKQVGLDLPMQITREISGQIKQWSLHYPELKCSDETPRTYWWEKSETGEVDVPPDDPVVTAVIEAEALAEQDLYPKLAAYLSEMTSRAVYPKRIDEKTASNTNGKNGNKSLHPDLVALEDLMPQTVWSNEVKEWATRAGAPQAKLWSFEVKIKLQNISDARESYLQALANSSWANYGYLVAAFITEKAFKEIKVLHDLHGVGLIQLDIDNPVDDTIVKLPARERGQVDWGTCNRIANQNADFKHFLEAVNNFYATRKTDKKNWDIPKLD
jgi:uncharacterized protein